MMDLLAGILLIIGVIICYAIGAAILSAMGMVLFGSFWRVLFTPVLVGFFAIIIPIALVFWIFKTLFVFLWACLPYLPTQRRMRCFCLFLPGFLPLHMHKRYPYGYYVYPHRSPEDSPVSVLDYNARDFHSQLRHPIPACKTVI